MKTNLCAITLSALSCLAGTALAQPGGTYASGLLQTVQAVNSRTTTLSYSGSNLAQVTNPDGGVHTFAYDGSHRLTGETFGGLQNGWAYQSSGVLGTFTWGSATAGAIAMAMTATAITLIVLAVLPPIEAFAERRAGLPHKHDADR